MVCIKGPLDEPSSHLVALSMARLNEFTPGIDTTGRFRRLAANSALNSPSVITILNPDFFPGFIAYQRNCRSWEVNQAWPVFRGLNSYKCVLAIYLRIVIANT